jgi:lambda family phage portal protein
VLHVFEKKRPGQRRGVSVLAPIIEPLKQLGDYTHAELTAAVVSGLFTVFIESEMGDVPDGMTGMAAESDDGVSDEEIKLEAGAVIGLADGEKVTTANPNRPNTAFDPFTQAIFKQIGAALSIPYEVLLKHFSSSYSASRAALLEAWKMFRARRVGFVSKFCQPVYEAFITECVLLGKLHAPGFIEDPVVRAAYLGTSWNGPAQGQLNPVQETKAAKMKVEEGFSTRSKEAAEMNSTDYDQNVSRAKSESVKYVESGLYDIKNETYTKEEE